MICEYRVTTGPQVVGGTKYDYPNGYNDKNCIIIGFRILITSGETRAWASSGELYFRIETDGLYIAVGNPAFVYRPISLFLLNTDYFSK